MSQVPPPAVSLESLSVFNQNQTFMEPHCYRTTPLQNHTVTEVSFVESRGSTSQEPVRTTSCRASSVQIWFRHMLSMTVHLLPGSEPYSGPGPRVAQQMWSQTAGGNSVTPGEDLPGGTGRVCSVCGSKCLDGPVQ